MAQAVQIADAALAKARERGCKPIIVAVADADAGGCLLALKREDGSANLRPDIAFAELKETYHPVLPPGKPLRLDCRRGR